jgi:hypothetical protein
MLADTTDFMDPNTFETLHSAFNTLHAYTQPALPLIVRD